MISTVEIRNVSENFGSIRDYSLLRHEYVNERRMTDITQCKKD
jgi:hypothetical protein